MKKLQGKLGYANVMATIAVFVALGGSAYAATQLKKNSVGTKQLKKNSVNGAKVKDQSLTGKDIDLSKLGQVPSAANANHAAVADRAESGPGAESPHIVGSPGNPAFIGGSGNTPNGKISAVPPVSFYKDNDGLVHLEGLALAGTEGSVPGTLFALPAGFRPPSSVVQFFLGWPGVTVLVGGVGASFNGINLDGTVFGEPGNSVSLTGITFRPGS